MHDFEIPLSCPLPRYSHVLLSSRDNWNSATLCAFVLVLNEIFSTEKSCIVCFVDKA